MLFLFLRLPAEIAMDLKQDPCIVMGHARAEIAFHILSFLRSLSYATIIKDRCPGVLHHVMGEQ
jgi:hypothetical protein